MHILNIYIIAIEYRKSIGGELAIRQYAHKMATEGGDIVANILGTQVMDNSTHTLITCMSNVELPVEQKSSTDGQVAKFIMTELVFTHHTMATVYKTNNKWWVRLCGQIYLDLDDFKQAGEALLAACNDFNKQEQ